MSMKELVEIIARALVENPSAVQVAEREEEGEIKIDLRVAQEDMGRVIGKQGRIAKAIRTVVKAAAVRKNIMRITVDIDQAPESEA